MKSSPHSATITNASSCPQRELHTLLFALGLTTSCPSSDTFTLIPAVWYSRSGFATSLSPAHKPSAACTKQGFPMFVEPCPLQTAAPALLFPELPAGADQDSSRGAVSRYCVSHSIVSHGQDKPGFAGAQLRSRKSWREAKGAPCHAEKTPPGKREVSSFPSVTAELGSCPETL